MSISFTGIRDRATFKASSLTFGSDEGKVCKVTANQTVGLCADSDTFHGVIETIERVRQVVEAERRSWPEDLGRAVAEGRFRQDLFYRVNVINIELPPLRDRISDIPLLAEHFLRSVCDESGKTVRGFTDEAMAAMHAYRWPGNVRELQNVIERAVLLGKRDVIGLEDLPVEMAAGGPIAVEPAAGRSLKEALEGPERRILLDVLEANQWTRHVTAESPIWRTACKARR